MKREYAVVALLICLFFGCVGWIFSGSTGAVTPGSPATLGSCTTDHSLTDSDDMLVCDELESKTHWINATDISTQSTHWISLTHDQTNGVISTGTGALRLSAANSEIRAPSYIVGVGTSEYPSMVSQTASSTAPSIRASHVDADTGINRAGDDALSLIAGGVEIARGTESTIDSFDIKTGFVVSTEAVTCSDATDTCTYSASVVSTRLTAGTDAGADTVTVTDGVDGQRRTFTVVAGTDDVTIDIMTNGSAAANVTLDAVGDSVTIEYDSANDTWWIVASNGL